MIDSARRDLAVCIVAVAVILVCFVWAVTTP